MRPSRLPIPPHRQNRCTRTIISQFAQFFKVLNLQTGNFLCGAPPAINRTDDALDVMLTMPNARVIIICMKNKVLPDFYAAARAVLEEASVLCGEPIPIGVDYIPTQTELARFFAAQRHDDCRAVLFAGCRGQRAVLAHAFAVCCPARLSHFLFGAVCGAPRAACAALSRTKFACFADNSPIGEVAAASKAGLGTIGESGLLITKRFGSFVFWVRLFPT